MTQTTATEDQKDKAANNCPYGIAENQGYQNTNILNNDFAGTDGIPANFENIYKNTKIINTISYSPWNLNYSKDIFMIFKAKMSC